jgi:predicted permease
MRRNGRLVRVKPDGTEEPTLIGLRDRALIGVMVYTFARINAVLQMTVRDYFVQGRRGWVRLHEKGGKEHEVPCHHNLEQLLDEYIEAASIARVVPLNGNSIQGDSIRTDISGEAIGLGFHDNYVAPDYFRTMAIPLLYGREFQPSDREGAPEVAILNENLAHRLFGNRNPIGHTFRYTEPKLSAPVTIVGVAKNSKYFTLGEENGLAMYWPYPQMGSSTVNLHFLVRAARPRDVVKEIAQTLGRLDASAAIEVKPMRDAMGFAFLPSRVGAALLGSMGLLGLALASIGLYGVLAYSVARRTREIGLRVALGADRAAVMRMVARESAVLMGIGLAIGMGISFFATKPLAMFLVPELSTSDPATFLTVVAVLGLVAFTATLGPVVRAWRVDPMVALRYE